MGVLSLLDVGIKETRLKLLKYWRVGLMGAAVSLLAVGFIISELDLSAVDDALNDAHFIYVVPCVLLLVAGLVTRGLRWRLLLSGGLSPWRAFHIMNVAYLVNGVLPLRIGEVARVFLASRAEPPVPVLKSAGTIVVERLLDLLAVVLMVAFALAAGPVPGRLQSAGLFFGVVGFWGFLVLVLLSRKRGWAHWLLRLFTERSVFLQKWNLHDLLDHFLDGLLPLARLDTLVMALAWTAISWCFSIAAGYVLMYTFYDAPRLAATCLYIAAAALAIAVPATVGNIGVYEGSIILALEAFSYGSSFETVFAFAVTVHAVNVFVHTVTGIVGFISEGITLDQLSEGVEEISRQNEQGRLIESNE